MAEITELDFTQTPCAACEQISTTNERMIGCDGCEGWFHCRCVGITTEIRLEEKWFCNMEACRILAYKNGKEKGAKKKIASKKNASDPDRNISVQQRLKEMEENQKRLEEDMEAELMLKKKESEFKRALEKKRMLLEQQIREEEEKEELALQEQILLERKMQLDRMKARQQSFQTEMASLDLQMAKLEGGDTGKPTKQAESKKTPLRNPDVEKLSGQNLKRIHRFIRNESSEDDYENEEEHSEDEETTDSSDTDYDSKTTNVKENGINSKMNRNGLEHLQCRPTKAQLAARSGISKKLPIFSGKPEEWPLFYGAYQASNEACGFSAVENLVRLQECIKGPALEMVRGQLLLPKSVPKVIEKLRSLYGRPEQLLQSYLEKVRKLEPPKAGKLASFIPFGTVVE